MVVTMSSGVGLVPAPKHLSARGRRLWRDLICTYSLDDPAGLELLRRACEASDRADQARDVLAKEGLTVATRFGEVRVHPAVAVERDSRNALRQLLRELRVTEPPTEDRIPRLGSVS
jgi:P27 family predicted phage terminase small subunit